MDSVTKIRLRAKISGLSATNQAFKGMMGMSPPPVIAGSPPMPIILLPALQPYLQALTNHADNFDRLLKLLDEMIDKS